jgi:dGTPase
MREYGGFEHNLQSLRVVDELEERYAEFRGLNLTFECREGILKHCSLRYARELGDLGERFIKRRQPGLEAQIANLADEIAYNNHDVDDGIRAQLLDLSALGEVRLFRRQHDEVVARYPQLGERRLVHETVRRMINYLVVDFIRTTQAQLERAQPRSIDDVRALTAPLAMLSDACREEHLELKAFLREHVYRHYKVLRMTSKARRVVEQLFEAFFKDVSLMPTEHRDQALHAESAHGAVGRARAVADYIAGMTDRYAILEHRRLFEPSERT